MKDNGVTIKINGKERPIKNEPKVVEENIQAPEIEIEDESPIIIVDETAAAIEKEEEFDWVLPEQEDNNEKKKKDNEEKVNTNSYIEDLRQMNVGKSTSKKPMPSSWNKKTSVSKQWVLSIMMAVGVGFGFGLVILYAMNVASTPTEPSIPAFNPIPVEEPKNDGTTEENPTGQLNFTFPETKVTVLQGGLFSSAESANETAKSYEQNGMAGVGIETYVFVAVGTDLEAMKALRVEEEYAKEFVIPEKSWSKITEADVAMLENVQPVFLELVTVSSQLLSGQAVQESVFASVREGIEKINNIPNESLSENVVTIKEEVVAAFSHVQTYATSQNASELWKAQQRLLNVTALLTK